MGRAARLIDEIDALDGALGDVSADFAAGAVQCRLMRPGAIDQAHAIGGFKESWEEIAAADRVIEGQQPGGVGALLEAVVTVECDGVDPGRDMIIALLTLHGGPVSLRHAVNVAEWQGRAALQSDRPGDVLPDLGDRGGIKLLETAPTAE